MAVSSTNQLVVGGWGAVGRAPPHGRDTPGGRHHHCKP
ncbi:sodium channel protein type 10 subunit alpha-like protein [Corchorus olitorius]|uniref:Sodium channel protein type 10 subunit alpha-like protein n=1 Tax=Corchorus olitorius TaxID=93759 RepID=A0A1R3G4X5_9ROSI|nr:sodium channel protein type 10 subunit alpha-like protein [Corchorus olitorius]